METNILPRNLFKKLYNTDDISYDLLMYENIIEYNLYHVVVDILEVDAYATDKSIETAKRYLIVDKFFSNIILMYPHKYAKNILININKLIKNSTKEKLYNKLLHYIDLKYIDWNICIDLLKYTNNFSEFIKYIEKHNDYYYSIIDNCDKNNKLLINYFIDSYDFENYKICTNILKISNSSLFEKNNNVLFFEIYGIIQNDNEIKSYFNIFEYINNNNLHKKCVEFMDKYSKFKDEIICNLISNYGSNTVNNFLLKLKESLIDYIADNA